MNCADKLGLFADLALDDECEEGCQILEAGDPNSIEMAQEYFDEELGFLSSLDRRELKEVWFDAIDDNLKLKVFLNAIKGLQSKYGGS